MGILFFLIFQSPDFTLADDHFSYLAQFVDWAYWPAIAAAISSLWRPSFLYPAAFYITLTGYAVHEISGFSLSRLDIQYMTEMAEFLAMSACALSLLRWIARRSAEERGTRVLARIDLELLATCIAFIAVGLHLGNYFWSGVAKVNLGPEPWSWALENPTQNMMLGDSSAVFFLPGQFPR